VVTGTLSSLSREEAAAEIRKRGGKSTGAVTRTTRFLVVGNDPSAKKREQARILGVPEMDATLQRFAGHCLRYGFERLKLQRIIAACDPLNTGSWKVMEEIEGAKRYFEYKERCIFCDIVRQELIDDERLVKDYDSFITITPFASRHPFETWIIPKMHQSSFLELSDAQFGTLAAAFKDTLRRLKVALNDPPFNYILHTRPTSREHHEYFHWHFEIIPKLTKMAGFEWGSGFYINPTTPEEAASYLKTLDKDSPAQKANESSAGRDG